MQEFVEIPANKKSIANRKKMYDIGINDVNYQVTPIIEGKRMTCPYYRAWHSMLTRCYSAKYKSKRLTYSKCTVCDDWLIFSIFRNWMMQQDWKDKQLDKDLLVRGNKEYSPTTCMFVTSAINNLLIDSHTIRGQYAIGVYWNKQISKYIANCSVDGKNIYLGCYILETEAHLAYLVFKKELIINVANTQSDVKLKQALLHIANTEY